MSFSASIDPELVEDVARAYSIEERIGTVYEVFVPGIGRKPSKVFRSHMAEWGDVITEPDIHYRVTADLMFGGLSALHMAAFEYSAWPVPFRTEVKLLLEEEALRPYFEEYYPYAPPILVSKTLRNNLPDAYRLAWLDELSHEGFEGSYRRFLHLDARFIADGVIGDFLELLDDYYVRGDHISDLNAVLKDPAKLRDWLGKDKRWQLMEGMDSFFEFALDLDAYLQHTDLPILRGHAWLHFAYWFGSGGKRMLEVAKMLAVAAMQVDGSESDEAAAQLIKALERLLDPNGYPAKVIELAEDVLEPWLTHSGAGERWNGRREAEPEPIPN